MHVAKTSRSEQLLNDPIKPLILRLSVPTIIAMMISTFYNLADTYFVSRIGTSAAGATGIVFSVMMIIQAVAFTIGMGAGNCMSRLMGKGDIESASKFLSTGWFLGFSIGFLLPFLSFCPQVSGLAIKGKQQQHKTCLDCGIAILFPPSFFSSFFSLPQFSEESCVFYLSIRILLTTPFWKLSVPCVL